MNILATMLCRRSARLFPLPVIGSAHLPEKHNNWSGKRSLLQSQGFGFVVLFSGPESRHLKSAADAKQKGTADGEHACKLARQEGFSPGTIIFLDIEEGGRLSPSYHDYLHAWTDALTRSHFRAGAYCSGVLLNDGDGKTITTVKDVQEHLAGAKLALWVFNDFCPPSPGCVSSQSPPPVAQGGFPRPLCGSSRNLRAAKSAPPCAL